MELFVQTNSKENIKRLQMLGIKNIIVGMELFSCRQATVLTYEEIKKASNDVAMYVLVNALIEEKYLVQLEEHLQALSQTKITGVIFQDFAVLQIVKEQQYAWECIYAPDTLNTNHQTLQYLQTLGVTGAMLAREISLAEKKQIQKEVNMPCIMQLHGVEYMAYSKRKLLQNYAEMTQKTIDNSQVTIQANHVPYACHIYEDMYGTHIVTKNQLLTLDVLDTLYDLPYGYIESLYLEPDALLEVVALYLQGLSMITEGSYDVNKNNLVEQLQAVQPQISYYHSFLFDQTVYKITDVRKREENERSK